MRILILIAAYLASLLSVVFMGGCYMFLRILLGNAGGLES